jgi:DNA-binding MarR family transcriptional regulator
LLSRLTVDTPTWVAALDMLVLGLGLGMVMQVLVLAVQNAVEYRYLGVATAGSTLFRQVGGSIGVSIFGAIFANRLAHELATRLPHGARLPTAANPAVVRQLPPSIHEPYIAAFATSLRPVFLAATGIALLAFLLTWLLRDVPLRQTARAEGIGEGFASPREDSSDRELERIMSSIVRGDARTRIYRQLIARASVAITPAETWLLARLRDRAPISVGALAGDLGVPEDRVSELASELEHRRLVAADEDMLDLTDEGRAAVGRLVEAGRTELVGLLENWQRADDQELAPALRRLAASLVAEIPEDTTPPLRRLA